MFTHSNSKQIAVLSLFVATVMTTNSFAADPKIVRASHVQAAREESSEAIETKSEDLSYSPQWPEPPNTGAIVMRLVFGTVVVLALCVGSLWLGKPWLKRLQLKSAGNPNFFIEASLPAGNRAMLYLVRVGNTQLIAGTDASGLKTLIAIPPTFKEVLDEQVPDGETEVAPPERSQRPLDRAANANSTSDNTLAALPRPFAGQGLFKSGPKD